MKHKLYPLSYLLLSRFAEENTSRPTLDGVQFPSLPQREKESLVARFSELEIK